MKKISGWLVLVVILGAGAAYYYWRQSRPPPPSPPVPVAAQLSAAPAPVAAAPAIRHPVETAPAAPAAPPLPTLAQSDAAMHDELAALLGERSLIALFYPDRIITRIVATIDNLPRPRAPVSMMPVRSVPGALITAGGADSLVIGPDNWARYAPYVAIAQAVDAKKLVDFYVRFYPLFQQAYEGLGYPKGYFNDRLIEAIDDLLAAPDISDPIKLVQPKVLYQFADPKLEARSAGQKIMIRMGSDNAAKVKTKLSEIRQELMARTAKR
ncbi:hypothetical protein GALL_215780 [mine drainage metagenome]|uniref:DUF3014 domain-containing protein n=1 Tax=mine drainage metagenome TaxID=410659 RepID=A0A1J5RWF9_9ZZZZ